MRSCDELKAEKQEVQQPIAEADYNEVANSLKKDERLCEKFGFKAGSRNGS